MTSHVIAYCSKELLFQILVRMHLILIAFWMIFICVFTKIILFLICTAEYGSNILLLLIGTVLLSTHDICSE